MSLISRNFTSSHSRFELRLLEKPIHRYRDPAAKIHDGGVFAFANGTNPEVIVLIEATGSDLKTSHWQYSFARLESAEMHVALDGKEVWTRARTPGIVGNRSDPYWLFFSASMGDE